MRRSPELPDEGEENYYFIDTSSEAELENFFPDISSLSPDELADEENVPKKYPITISKIKAAVEDEEIRDFKEANYHDIRHAGSYIDEVLHDLDNGRDLLERDIRNRLTEAYQKVNKVRERVRDFEPDSTHLIYTDESKEVFMDYLEDLEGMVEAVGEEVDVNVEREFENRNQEPFEAYTALEPSEEPGIEARGFKGSTDSKASAD